MLNIQTRKNMDSLRKVLIGGIDGSGKSSFAFKYCRENGLNEVVVDIEDTNFTESPLINDLDISTDRKALKSISEVLKSVKGSDYDTIVIDGVDVLIEAFVSNAAGMRAYADRSKTFSKFVKLLRESRVNFILIGQAPILLEWYIGTEENPNKVIVRANAMCNEVYMCTRRNDNFDVVTVKYRGKGGE